MNPLSNFRAWLCRVLGCSKGKQVGHFAYGIEVVSKQQKKGQTHATGTKDKRRTES